MLRRIAILSFALATPPALAQVEGFSGVTEVAQGAPYQMTYQGTLTGTESFGFTRRGDDALIYDHYGNTTSNPDEQPVLLYAPDVPGEYDAVIELDFEIRWRLPVTVTPADLFLSAPGAAKPGDWVDVTWSGPGGFDDRVRVARPGDPDNLEVISSIVGVGSPTGVKMPDEAGTYELRYAMGSEPEAPVLGRTSITIGVAAAYDQALADAGGLVELRVPAEVQTGGPVDVGFGTLSNNWMVQFVRPGEDNFLEGQGGTFGYLVANPMRIEAPFDPGSYEIVALDPNRLARARVPITVVAATAALAIVSDDSASNYLEVQWSGPAGTHDRIGFAPAGAPAKELDPLTVNYINLESSPTTIRRPLASGDYELRYVQGAAGRDIVLAAQPYRVP